MFLYLSSSLSRSTNQRPKVVRLTSANLSALGFRVSQLSFNWYLVSSPVVRFFINGHLVSVGEKRYIFPGDVVTFEPCTTNVVSADHFGRTETIGQKAIKFALLFDGWPTDNPPPKLPERMWPEDLFDALRDHALAPHYAGVRWSAPH